jgi:uncharacterized membrane protein
MKKYKPIENFLSAGDLGEIEAAVAEAEKTTAGEIKVIIVAKSRTGLYRVFDPVKAVEMRAIREFKKMGVHKTKARTGVLLMVSAKERRIRIIADEGIHFKAEGGTWDGIVEMVSRKTKEGKQKEAVASAVAAIGETLTRHFPRETVDKNELSDEVVVQE